VTVRVDPEQNETRALFDLVDIEGRRVLEIGSGDGRLTWRYVDRAALVTAVEPFAPAVARAEDNLPQALARHVVLRRAAFGEFAAETAASSFDVAIFSWSLCCMERDDMVPALEEAHRLVGTEGTVVDVHAVSGTAEVEVHRTGEIAFAEPASTSDGEGERNADEAVATVVARGLFVPERRTEFDFRVYAPALRELRDFLEEADAHARREGSETSDAYESQLYERVEQMIAAGPSGAEVAYHERAGITRLKPVGT
jgi:SAM-dependent methyltransferase